jgi:hypothetical protein
LKNRRIDQIYLELEAWMLKLKEQYDSQTSRIPSPDREEVLLSNPMKESQQHEVTMPKGDKIQNGKRNTEMKITEKKARKLSKKREKIETL